MLHCSLLTTSMAALLLVAAGVAPSAAAEPSGAARPTAAAKAKPDAPKAMRTDPDAATMALRASPPSCVSIYSQGSSDMYVYNGCSTQQRVKVIIAFGWDTPCVAINPGGYGYYDWTIGRFDGLAAC
jgi:hypothetical protein